ncbi:hypothetical protein [Argonema antarcticum]|uniref:hypothetical protein n=1 Tax=Argonema antarcticum TaxID=2942763 RepID=UPI002013240E|nr:hypothetical protein [Argonema antarcticum]MCL1470090.1 hypothetical protein [Argonema antarcticum A004/B2]
MPYEIWKSLEARQKLQELEPNDSATARQIQERLNRLAVDQEDFITGAPEKLESFTVGKLIVIYRVGHRLRIVDVLDIKELP